MMRSSFVRRQLLLVVAAVVITSALTSSVYSVYARNTLAEFRSSEMAATAKRIAKRVEDFNRGVSTFISMVNELQESLNLLDAGCVVYWVNDPTTPILQSDPLPVTMPTQEMIETVLSGSSLEISGPSIWRMGSLTVGYPIFGLNGSVVGAVFLVRSIGDLVVSVSTMNTALVGIMVAAVLFMMLPTFFGAWLLSRPIYQMRDVALRMARGDFSARARETVRGEIGELGATLNFLSGRLSETISALQLEQRRLLSIVDGLGEGILAMDSRGEITHINPALLRMFNHGTGAGETIVDGIFEDDTLLADFRMTMETKTPLVRSMVYGGAVFRVTITPLEDEEGRGDGAVGLFRDVTEQERLEQTRRDYVANVSHELRTPISSVRGLAEALHDGMIRTDEDRQRYYGYILRESLRLSRLVEDLLELSRLQSGTIALKKQKVNLRGLILEFHDRYMQETGDVGIEFEYDIAEDCPDVLTNPDRVEQVLVVLLDNAIKFTPAEGKITLEVKRADERMLVSVRDTGVGIDPEDVPHVFDRFYKVDKSHSGQGTGLGLSIAKEIISRLGEEIFMESVKGEGTVFTFTLSIWKAATET